MPVKAIDGGHDVVIDAAICTGFGNHFQNINTDGKAISNNRTIDIVSGVTTQFGYSLFKVTDFNI